MSTHKEFLEELGKTKTQDFKKNPQGFAIRNVGATSPQVITVNASASETPVEPEESAPTSVVQTQIPAPVWNQEQLQALIADSVAESVKSAIAPLQTQLQQSKQAHNAESEQRQALQQQLDDEKTQSSQLRSQLQEAQKDSQRLEDLGRLNGRSVVTNAPSVNRMITGKSDKMEGALKEWFEIRNSAPVKYKAGRRAQIETRDNRELNRFTKENRQHLITACESWGRANGLFQGARVTNAATVGADIIGGFLPVLSAIMRQNNRPAFVWWQFPTTRIEFDKGEGDTVRIPRAAYQPQAQDINDRLLSGNGTFVRITNDSQNLATATVTAQLNEYGMGKDANSAPISIASFTEAYSMIDLLAILTRNVGFDYYSWENLAVRSLYTPTSRLLYNNGNRVSSTVPTAGGNGTTTRRFLTALRGYMKEQQIPPFMNQHYGYVMPSTSVTQLSQDMDKFWSPATPEQLMALTEIMNPSLVAPGETDRITGYVGNIEGFMIFEDNSYGVGAPGSPGVRNQTIAGGAVTTRSGYAFGADTTGRGIGTEMELRFDEVTNFGRETRVIWLSHEAFVAIDVDPAGYADTSPVPQQLRVVEVRLTDTEV